LDGQQEGASTTVFRNRRRVTAAATLVLVPLASGCAAGQDAQTSRQYQATEAVSATHNGMEIRNLFVLGPGQGQALPAGAAAPVYLALVNNSAKPDQLLAISAPGLAAAGQVPEGSVALPPKQIVTPGFQGQPPLTLQQLAGPLRGGEWRRITFQFREAGTVTVSVPVVPRQGTYLTYSPAPTPPGATAPGSGPVRPGAGSASPTGSPSGSPSGRPPRGKKKKSKAPRATTAPTGPEDAQEPAPSPSGGGH
jgi:copper(I)-binding protein